MAERKLRFDAADAAAVPRPRGRVAHTDDTDAAGRNGTALDTGRSDDLSPRGATGNHRKSDETPGRSGPPREVDSGRITASSGELEKRIREKLDSQLDMPFSSLKVRQLEDGICLEGVLETDDQLHVVERLVRSVVQVDRILNRLVVRAPEKPPD